MVFFQRMDRNLEENIMVALLVLLSFVMLLQVIMRYVFSHSLPWPEEFTRYCFVGMAAMSFSYSIRKRIILRIDIVVQIFPKFLQNIMEMIVYFVTLLFFGYVFYHSIFVVIRIKASGQVSPALGIPMYILFIVLSSGFFLAVVRSLQVLVSMIRERDIDDGTQQSSEIAQGR